MGAILRRVGSVAVSVGLVVAAWVLSARDGEARLASARVSAHRDAQLALGAARTGLRAQVVERTRLIAGLSPVKNLVAGPAVSHRETWDDFFTREVAFAPFRAAGASAGIAVGASIISSWGEPTEPQELVTAAAETREATAFAEGPRLIAAVRLAADTPNGLPVVVFYARPIDEALLAAARERPTDQLVVRAGQGTVATGTVPELAAFLSGPTPDAACCATEELLPGASLVAYRDPSALLSVAEGDGQRNRVLFLAGAGVLSLIALAFGFWPRHKTEQLLRDTSAELQRSREELARLSQVLTASGGHALNPAVASSTIRAATDDDGLGATRQSVTGSRYQVLDLLGEGGMARVYIAVAKGAEGFRRIFVLKRLRPELLGNTDAVNQFIDEGRLGASLVHSNIVPVFDFGHDSEGYFLAQEYILGRNVEALVKTSVQRRGRALEPSVVLYLAQEALKALAYAHTKTDDAGRPLSLVHRDVSANNLMLSALGELKLLDFGIVKGEQRLTRTQTGMVKGNLFYMSPEQARGQPVDARSDLFSLGLVLYFAATGQTLVDGATNYELLSRTATCPTADDLARIRRLPPPLGPLIERALSNDVAGRWASADVFAQAVAAAGPAAPAATVRALMDELFHDDLAAEQARVSGRNA